MTSRVFPGEFGAEPNADPAVRPPGLSLGQWLSSKAGSAEQIDATPRGLKPSPSLAGSGHDISEIHRRLDSITQQINQISQGRVSRPATAASASGLAGQLNDAISRLDSRLARLSQDTGRYQEAAQSYADPVRSEMPPPGPASAPPRPATSTLDLNNAIAEINARRGELDRGQAFNAAPQQPSPPLVPSAQPSPSLTSLEQQLHHITSQMETLRRPDTVDHSITAFREELAEIRRSLTEALPRRAIDSLEAEIRSLAQRIDRNRDDGGDHETLTSIERALNDIYGVVRTLTPAEQLQGYDAAIGKLSEKIDLIVRANPDNGVQQLQDAITALRGIVSNVASNEALGRLSDHIHALSEKVDHLAASSSSDMLSALEQRIALLTSAMESRPQGMLADAGSLEAAVRALTDRMDNLGHADGAAGMAQIEQRITYLLERLETVEPRFNNSSRVEESLGEILRHLEYQRQVIAGLAEGLGESAESIERGIVDSIKRELSEVRGSQAENDRRTQDTLEAVHSTLSHVVDRLSMIEGDLKRVQPAPPLSEMLPPRPTPIIPNSPAVQPLGPVASVRPELPNPAALAHTTTPTLPSLEVPNLRAAANRSEAEVAMPAGRGQPQRPPIDSTLPPDYPLEPGARRLDASSAERSVAGASPDNGTAASRDGSSKSNFIAAARRAAQAAAAATAATQKPSRITVATDAARSAAARAKLSIRTPRQPESGAKQSKIKALVVGICVAIIVFGGFRIAMNLLIGGENAPADKSSTVEPQAAEKQKLDVPATAPLAPPVTERQSLIVPPPSIPAISSEVAPPARSSETTLPENTVAPAAASDVTGSTPQSSSTTAALSATQIDNSPAAADKIPDLLGSVALRAAALRGEPNAAFEVAVRYAEGKGVAVNYTEAVKWYERAAQKGVVPAMFRLGTILEKGSNGSKDIDGARRYYVLAAERGNAKAMHNLAVLDADGGGKGPNYKSAAVWFRKAADHGVADSQYNLGVLYARGIGVEQNLAESFKWFSLAAAQGDADAVRKRDDVAKRLDPQSLAAAKLAIQTFTPEPQPDDAINVAAPAGGWDNSASASGKHATKSAAKPVKQRDASR